MGVFNFQIQPIPIPNLHQQETLPEHWANFTQNVLPGLAFGLQQNLKHLQNYIMQLNGMNPAGACPLQPGAGPPLCLNTKHQVLTTGRY